MKVHILFIEKKNECLGNRQKILWNIVVYCETIILLICNLSSDILLEWSLSSALLLAISAHTSSK